MPAPPALQVARAFATAAGEIALLPLAAAAFWFERESLAAEVRELVAPEGGPPGRDARPLDAERPARWPQRPLSILLSWAEPSGETIAGNLVRELRNEAEAAGAPAPRIAALGGARGADWDIELVARPADHAAMGVGAVVRALPFYAGVLRDAARHLKSHRPDVFIPIDSPGLHVPLGRIARAHGVAVCHFVTPQYWAWAPWRVRGYRRAVDRALTILPFEPAWFARRGVSTLHVGHPIVDALAAIPAPSREREGSIPERLVLLPGSRRSVVSRNLPWMLSVARELQAGHPGLELVLPSDRPELLDLLERLLARFGAAEGVRLAPGGLHTELARAGAALSVSGTVLLDCLHQRVPTVVVYRLGGRLAAALAPQVLLTPWFSSPNLLAGEEVLPEHAFAGDGPRREVVDELTRCLTDAAWRRRARAGLDRAARRLGPPGAVRRAARAALGMALDRLEGP